MSNSIRCIPMCGSDIITFYIFLCKIFWLAPWFVIPFSPWRALLLCNPLLPPGVHPVFPQVFAPCLSSVVWILFAPICLLVCAPFSPWCVPPVPPQSAPLLFHVASIFTPGVCFYPIVVQTLLCVPYSSPRLPLGLPPAGPLLPPFWVPLLPP